MKWIVFWVLMTMVSSYSEPKVNEYGIKEGFSYPVTTYHYDTLSKEFADPGSAILFIENSTKYWENSMIMWGFEPRIKKIWLEYKRIERSDWLTGDTLLTFGMTLTDSTSISLWSAPIIPTIQMDSITSFIIGKDTLDMKKLLKKYKK